VEAEHDSKIAGHFGSYKTIGRVRANFYWPKMDTNITQDVRSCDVCQSNKVIRHKKFGLLEPFKVPMRPWKDCHIRGLHCWVTKVPWVYDDMCHRRQVLQGGTFHSFKEGGTH